ncbi:hypothetical protein PVAND_002415 [Polypedilum vanderplanki]|uniref:LIM zinc-binding domain-containing protein n=1 Tax=Polypedilum vanderplanki TaxID=319348 RepID=A0A9J6BQX3_POLVA|nr:hypothetical protein PVAND_002415 [Polypedilum vanderplanki]
MPSGTDMMENSSQYSSCETLDSHRSSECDEKNEVNGNARNRKISAEHSEYIVKERVTRKEPPKPVYNPLQFVKIKPSNLCQTAQEQLKKAEEVKKVKEVTRKEDPEDWQNNLDNWKSSRRKRVEHIIDRVVEVKKLEEEEHDRNRRSIKTFSELMEERGSRRKLSSLAIYTEDDSTINMSDLAPASDTSNLNDTTNSDNHRDKKVASDDAFNNNNSNNDFHSTALIKDIIHKKQPMTTTLHQEVQDVKAETEVRVMKTTTKTLRSFESRERDYTYDDAIEDYKTRVTKLDLPKVDINKRRELFEKDNSNGLSTSAAAATLGTEIVSIKERISSLRSNLTTNAAATVTPAPKKLEVPVSTSLKDRLSSLHQQVSSPIDENKRAIIDTPFKNVQEARNEFELKQQQQQQQSNTLQVPIKLTSNDDNESLGSTDREDSGIHTTDISCAVSQSDEQQQSNERIEEFHHVMQEKFKNLNVSEPQQQPDVIKNIVEEQQQQHEEEEVDDSSDDRIEEALESAFQLIDSENIDSMPSNQLPMNGVIVGNNNRSNIGELSVNKSNCEPIYQNVDDKKSTEDKIEMEPHYQVPRSREPYYEMPKKHVPIPLYENIELMFPASSDSSRFSMAESNESFGIDDGTEMVFPIDQSKYLNQAPPSEKPPPPPIPEEMSPPSLSNQNQVDNFKRINSTKRIKKEIRSKRSSFLGIDIEGQDFDDNNLELSVVPPPNIQAILQEEKRLEKQLYQKVGLYENSLNCESRDSGLDNHSRQGSEPSSASSSEGQTEVDGNTGGMLLSEKRGNFTHSYTVNEDDNRIKSLEEQISQQEEVLRVEQLLLQIEQQELKRQRENLIMRKNIARRELDEGVRMLMTTNNNYASSSLQNLNDASTNVTNGGAQYDNNVSYRHMHNSHPHNHLNEYRKSMPNLQDFNVKWSPDNDTTISNDMTGSYRQSTFDSSSQMQSPSTTVYYGNMSTTSSRSEMHLHTPRPYQSPSQQQQQQIYQQSNGSNSNLYGNMTRHALMQISAVPKPKLTNDWVQYRKSEPAAKPSLSSHWLLQEAEQRRIEQMNNVRMSAGGSKKPLPDAIIQTIRKNVIEMGIGTNVNKRYTVFDSSKQMPQITQSPSHPLPPPPLLMMSQQQQQSNLPNSGQMMHNPLTQQQQQPILPPHMLPQLDVLSVSSKKICSYCNRELGSGAAMIIENLGLFYHIDCFKCSVCQTPIADGNINGTDVRVRNAKLHCANCFSNEEGIKFSCV